MSHPADTHFFLMHLQGDVALKQMAVKDYHLGAQLDR